MSTVLRTAAACAALVLWLSPVTASADAVSEARARCSSLKQQVHSLEDSGLGSSQTAGLRKQWERACAEAHALMSPHPAPLMVMRQPPAQLRYAEKLSAETLTQFRRPPSAAPPPGHRFRVTILDAGDEAARLAPPSTRAAASIALGKPVPLF